MAKITKLEFPFLEVRGELDGLIFRKNKSGTISCYAKPQRNLVAHPVTEKETASRKSFARIAAMAAAIEKDPAELAKHQVAYEVFCSVKKIPMHAYLMKVCSVLDKKGGEG